MLIKKQFHLIKALSVLILFFIVNLLANFSYAGVDSSRAIKKDYPLTALTKRVHVIHGPMATPSVNNQGFRNNPVIVTTSAGVVVFDPGSSVYVGEMILKKVKSLTDKPVVAVFNSHIHGDHWLGNAAFKQANPKVRIYGHPKMKERAELGDGDVWVKAINKSTKGAITGTKPLAPNQAVKGGDTIKIGDMQFRIIHTGTAHTDNDLMIEVIEEGVLYFGDNWRNKQASQLIGSFKGNMKAIDTGLATKATIFIPGHGQSGDKNSVLVYRDFLSSLRGLVKKYFEADLSGYEMKPKIIKNLSKYKKWAGFDANIGRLISIAFLEIENDSF